jgi:dTDP-D-glucose 4,6-dehydratase
LDWKPEVDFDKGIEQCIQWVDKNWNVIKTLPLEYIHKE